MALIPLLVLDPSSKNMFSHGATYTAPPKSYRLVSRCPSKDLTFHRPPSTSKLIGAQQNVATIYCTQLWPSTTCPTTHPTSCLASASSPSPSSAIDPPPSTLLLPISFIAHCDRRVRLVPNARCCWHPWDCDWDRVGDLGSSSLTCFALSYASGVPVFLNLRGAGVVLHVLRE
ncbi:hypothetical protein BC835DRAFT_542223 [Cytidiella melzeri]|nr:hypothetical protein BC835DRAFT_542223 [Cytidiella melzeri]